MTQIKEAFREAGFLSPNERLREIALQAMSRNATSTDAAIEVVLKAVRGDLALTWALFTAYDTVAVKRLFADLRHDLREDEKARDGGPHGRERHGAPASAARQGGGQRGGEPLEKLTPSQPPGAITAEQRAAKGATAEVIRMSLLDTFQIDGRPIGDWHAGEARTWARTTGRHVRWVEMLTSNMPADDPIRRWITPEDAASLWQRSGREGYDA